MNLITLPEPWTTDIGYIQNLVEESCCGVGLIVTKAGGVRANHYHREDWHYLYVIDGSFEYRYKSVKWAIQNPTRSVVVSAGQMLYTPPREAHAMKFLEDTTMISISKLPRTHESHEADVVRLEVPLV